MQPHIILATVLLVAGVASVWWLSDSSTQTQQSTETSSETIDPNQVSNMQELAPLPDPVASVNGENISSAAFTNLEAQIIQGQGVDPSTIDPATQAMLRDQVLDSAIAQELLTQAVSAAAITIPENALEAQLEQVRSQFPDATQYEAALANEGVTEAELLERFSTDLQTQTYLEQTLDLGSLTVDEAEVTSSYEQIAAQQEVPPLDEVRGEVEQFALEQKQQALIEQHLTELREAATIEVFM